MTRTLFFAASVLACSAAASANEPPVYRTTLLDIGARTVTVEGGATLRRARSATERGADARGRRVYLRLDDSGAVEDITTILPRHSQPHDIADLPPEDFVIAARSVPSSATDRVILTIVVAVPSRTPSGDDIYLSTERTGFGAAELRMNRVDPLHWSIDVPLPRGSTLVYRFTRGSSSNAERDAAGGGVPAHSILVDGPKKTRDAVASWADVP